MTTFEHAPDVAITNDAIFADDGDTVFGKRWGSQVVTIDTAQLAALQQGQYLAVDVQSEYVVYLKL
ncbi:MAG: hypothetical protein WAO71_12600 [Gallionella sp.]